ncbi:unnamed protein product [Pedinophyceae sp. YPF-701]|nr:unnamed protein product [Pedinophyceae sp. YPF-701]
MSHSFSIEDLPGKGRGLVAARPLHAGEVIVAEEPALTVVCEAYKEVCCCSCLRQCTEGQSVCQACGQASFCGQNCWNTATTTPGVHDPMVCTGLRGLAGAQIPAEDIDSVRFVIHALALRHASATSAPALERYSKIMALCGMPSDTRAEYIHKVACHALGVPGSAISDMEIAALLQKDVLNSYGVMAGPSSRAAEEHFERDVRAGCIYPIASLVNHDCMPNAARVDNFDNGDTRIALVALHDIQQGQEICQSYVPLNWAWDERKAKLSDYGFECRCERCRTEFEWPSDGEGDGVEAGPRTEMDMYLSLFFIKYICPNEKCGGTLVPLVGQGRSKCNVCGKERSEEEFQQEIGAR